jgi:hypothetical protein
MVMSHILLSFYEGRGDHLIAGNIMFDYIPPIGSFVALRDDSGNLAEYNVTDLRFAFFSEQDDLEELREGGLSGPQSYSADRLNKTRVTVHVKQEKFLEGERR